MGPMVRFLSWCHRHSQCHMHRTFADVLNLRVFAKILGFM